MKRKMTVAIALTLALVTGTASATFAISHRSGSNGETDLLQDAIAPVDQVECKRVKC